MSDQFKALPYHKISTDAKVNRRTHKRPTKVKLTDMATAVMTDFNIIVPISIDLTASIDKANDKMIACGVRLLFVTGQNGTLVGLITATDILGEKPVLHVTNHGGKREDIIVSDIMTAKEQMDVLHMTDVVQASVGDIIETIKMFKRQHMLVVEQDSSGQETLRGIYSTTQINRQLGINIEPSNRADSFADIEKALVTAGKDRIHAIH